MLRFDKQQAAVCEEVRREEASSRCKESHFKVIVCSESLSTGENDKRGAVKVLHVLIFGSTLTPKLPAICSGNEWKYRSKFGYGERSPESAVRPKVGTVSRSHSRRQARWETIVIVIVSAFGQKFSENKEHACVACVSRF